MWVGGGRHSDGIVIAANRLAKQSGVKTGMACFEAARLCPQGVPQREMVKKLWGTDADPLAHKSEWEKRLGQVSRSFNAKDRT